MEENSSRKVGALWIKQGTKGEYMSGELLIDGQKFPIVCFKNEKLSEKHPDWSILRSKPLEGIKTA